jgi:hypothetical protein
VIDLARSMMMMTDDENLCQKIPLCNNNNLEKVSKLSYASARKQDLIEVVIVSLLLLFFLFFENPAMPQTDLVVASSVILRSSGSSTSTAYSIQ